MRPNGLFTYAFLATALVDVVALVAAGTEPTLIGRVVVCLVLGFLASRKLPVAQTALATVAGVLGGTFLTLTSYIRTEAALQQPDFLRHLAIIVAMSVAVALVCTPCGIAANRLAGRLRHRAA